MTQSDQNASEDGTSRTETPLSEMRAQPGAQIGPYRLLQEIGHGGMGMVYMADQREPVKRRVALKLIKPGMDSRQVQSKRPPKTKSRNRPQQRKIPSAR